MRIRLESIRNVSNQIKRNLFVSVLSWRKTPKHEKQYTRTGKTSFCVLEEAV